MPSYTKLYWICPFYRWDEKSCVHCEGGSKVTFPDVTTKMEFYRAYCAHATGWQTCSVAMSLNKYYERKEAPNNG